MLKRLCRFAHRHTKPADAKNPVTPRLAAISSARWRSTAIVSGKESAPSPAQMLYHRFISRSTSENVERRSRLVDPGSSLDRLRRVSRWSRASWMADSETGLGKASLRSAHVLYAPDSFIDSIMSLLSIVNDGRGLRSVPAPPLVERSGEGPATGALFLDVATAAAVADDAKMSLACRVSRDGDAYTSCTAA